MIVGVIGLGYVGLPLALALSKKKSVIAFDTNLERISQLKNQNDSNGEFKNSDFKNKKILFTNDPSELEKISFYIVTVPSPVLKNKKPDLRPLVDATKNISKFLKKNDIIVYESTVFPGCTEDFLVPIIEKISKLKYNKDFFCGYSPERINPGDKKNKLENIKKITSGSNKKISTIVDNVYKQIITAGTIKVSSIKVAESAKVVENIQRDLNIALVNQLSILFDKLKIDFDEVLKASSTKWNFVHYKPGLVGGHCIGVDPYYLSYISKEFGYKINLIDSARSINESMSKYITKHVERDLPNKKNKRNILIMGATFKENCSDFRNSKVLEIFELLRKKYNVSIYDPFVGSNKKIKNRYTFIDYPKNNFYDLIIIAVCHDTFLKMGIKKISRFGNQNCKIYDLKNQFDKSFSSFRL